MKFGPYIKTFLSPDNLWATSDKCFRICGKAAVLLSFFFFLSIFSTSLEAQCVVSCKSSLNISLGLNGQSVMTPGILLVDPSCDPNDFTVSITDNQGNNYGNTVTCANIGQTLTALVTQTATGNACATSLYIYDYLPPFLTCLDTTIICTASADPDSIGYPSVYDNCSNLDSTALSYSDQVFDLACFTSYNGDSVTTHIERTWTAIDDYGNTKTCLQHIYLRRATIADVEFPKDRNGFDAPMLDCSEDPFNLTTVGEPTIEGKRIDANGYCEFVISYSDQIVPNCAPAGYTIIRTWTLIDWCADVFTLHAQLIKIKDLTPPVLTCPADITVGTNVDDCMASVILPNASATDDCSTFTITPSWAFGTGTGPFSNVPLGIHLVTYTAEDACGNTSICTINVQVIDNVPPVPVCDAITIVNLTSNGSGYVAAASFNDGSNDNCTLGDILISRDELSFSSGIFFDCNDLASSPLALTLRVYDAAGNFNDCSVTAIIEDKLAPILVCPSTAYLECSEDYLDLGLTGQALVQDNCEVDTVYFLDNVQLNTCNVGQITRTWTVKDHSGNSTSCLQLIYLEDNTPLQVNSFPANYSTNVCGASLDPATTGNPIVSNDDCEWLYIGYTDDTLSIAYPACFVINRKWEIIDWCNHDPNANPVTGYWTHTQVISVSDIENPVLQSPADITVGSFSTDCGGAFVSLPEATATDCSPNISIINNSPYASQNGADASGIYPVGIHTVYFTAQDGCGNTSNSSLLITVADSLAPQAVCFDGLSLTIGMGGTVDLLPSMLDAGSFDNCSLAGDLLLSVSPATFSCADLGANEVTLAVMDENGNVGICVAMVEIQNNMGQCPFVQLSGGVEKENGTPMAGVNMALTGGTQGDFITGTDGRYDFQNLAIGGNYSVEPSKLTRPENGVSTLDLIMISRHMLGLLPIATPYKLIAADVDNNKWINTFDIIQMQKVILFIDTVFLHNPSWRFIDADYVFSDPANPFSSSFPEIIQWNDLQEDVVDADFVAIKTGDVSGNANPIYAQGEGASRSTEEPLLFSVEDKDFAEGERFRVPVKITKREDLLGFQFTFSFDPEVMTFEEINFSALADDLGMDANNFGRSHKEKGLITASWFSWSTANIEEDERMIELVFTAKRSGRLSNHLRINSQLAEAEAYNEAGEVAAVELAFLSAEEKEETEEIMPGSLANFPNPFVEETTIAFDVKYAATAVLSVFDGQGKMVFQWKENEVSGHRSIRINGVELGMTSGVYFYQLDLGGGNIKTEKMLKL